MNGADLMALWLTVKLAAVSTAVLVVIGAPLAWWLANTKWKGRFLIDAVVALPLVLPPTVLGFYLLLALGARGPFADFKLAFSFTGLVIGSVIYSLPFVVQPMRSAFASVDSRVLDASETLGASGFDRFFSIVVPLSRRGILTATVLGFSHTVGEFGVVLMLGGNLPGETQTASIRIYEYVEALKYESAHGLAITLVVASFVLLSLTYFINRREGRPYAPGV